MVMSTLVYTVGQKGILFSAVGKSKQTPPGVEPSAFSATAREWRPTGGVQPPGGRVRRGAGN